MILYNNLDEDKQFEIKNKLILRQEEVDDSEHKPRGILDIQDHCMSLEEVELSDIDDFTKYNLRYEDRYVRLLKSLFSMNKGNILLEGLEFNELESITILRMLEELDYKDKLLFVDLVKKYGNENADGLYLLEDADEAELVTKLMVRELYFPIVHFIDLGICIRGGYDLSLPVFFRDEETFVELEGVINRHQLFVRSVVR